MSAWQPVTPIDWIRQAGLWALDAKGRIATPSKQLVEAWAAIGIEHDSPFRDYVENASRWYPTVGFFWARSGFSGVDVSAKLAASLISTSVATEALPDLRLPWPAMRVHCPPGVVGDAGVDGVVCEDGEGGLVAIIHDRATDLVDMATEPKGLSEFARLRLLNISLETERNMETWRRTSSWCRLVFGVCVELATRPAKRPSFSVGETRRTGEPVSWNFRLTRNVVVDCRPAVRAYVEHGGRHPTVQSLVRGHHKRQPCGPGGVARKWIHVEPYWRGPEDAPIAVRSHVLGES